MSVNELCSFLKGPEEEIAMEDSPTMVKEDRGQNLTSPSRRRRRLPKALAYVTGDMREFANWLKGIFAPIPWRDVRSGFGRNR